MQVQINDMTTEENELLTAYCEVQFGNTPEEELANILTTMLRRAGKLDAQLKGALKAVSDQKKVKKAES